VALHTTLIVLAALALLYAAFVAALIAAGRRNKALALASLVPHSAILVKRLVRDPRVSRRTKIALVLLGGYLALPFDLVPDFIPVAGQLDDAILVVLAFRALLRDVGPAVVRELWPGPAQPLGAVVRLGGGAAELC
jgi:uncharacterized membrane protein YkvA (DUF1232 family)